MSSHICSLSEVLRTVELWWQRETSDNKHFSAARYCQIELRPTRDTLEAWVLGEKGRALIVFTRTEHGVQWAFGEFNPGTWSNRHVEVYQSPLSHLTERQTPWSLRQDAKASS